ncbi:MAG: hypothetical protein ACRDGA_13625, partial [Bacteroidota bacterium]
EKKFITFGFTKGSPATLVVRVPQSGREKPAKKEAEEKKEEDNDRGFAMAKMMLKDLKISSVVELQGSVVESNATFREGSKVTLLDVDFDKLLDDENLLRDAMRYQDVQEEEAKELMKKYPGLKVELNKEVRVRFR